MVGQRSGPALLSEHSTSYPTVHAAPTPVAAPERSTVLKSPRRGWGSGRGSYLLRWWAELHNNDPAPRWRLVLPSNTVNKTRRSPLRQRPSLVRTAAPSKSILFRSKPIFSSVRAFQHRQRAHSTAPLSFQARACFEDPSSLLPIQRIQTLWCGNRPLKTAWQPRCCGPIPIMDLRYQ